MSFQMSQAISMTNHRVNTNQEKQTTVRASQRVLSKGFKQKSDLTRADPSLLSKLCICLCFCSRQILPKREASNLNAILANNLSYHFMEHMNIFSFPSANSSTIHKLTFPAVSQRKEKKKKLLMHGFFKFNLPCLLSLLHLFPVHEQFLLSLILSHLFKNMAELRLTKHFSVRQPILGSCRTSQVMVPLDFSKEYSLPHCIKIALCVNNS